MRIPSGFQSSRIFVLTMFMGGGLLGMETSGYQYILLKIAKEFGLSQTGMGGLVSVHFLAVTLMPPLMGVLADRAGKRPVIWCGCALYLLGASVCCLSSTAAGFAWGIFAVGAAFGTLLTTCQAALSDSAPGASGRYVSALQGTLCAGCVLSPVILSFVMNAFDCTWRILFLICSSGFILMAGLLFFAEFPEQKTLAEKRQSGRKEAESAEGNRAGKAGTKLCSSWISKNLMGVMLGIFLYMFVETALTSFLDSYFSKELADTSLSAPALSLFWAAMAAIRFISGRFYRFSGLIVMASLILSAALLLALGSATAPIQAMALYTAAGLSLGSVWPFLLAIATDRYPEHTGLVTGLVMLVDGGGAALSPVLIGYISDTAGLRPVFYLLSSILLLLALSFFLLVRRELR